MKNRVIWCGIGKNTISLFESVHGLLDYIEYFVDEHFTGERFLDRKVVSPEHLRSSASDTVVVCSMEGSGYGRMAGQVWKAEKWIAHLLASDSNVWLQPVKVRLEACTICQLNCSSCYMRMSNYGHVGRGYLHLEDFKKFIHTNPFVKKIELSNSGEVFLNPYLLEILKYGCEKGLEFTISNGVNFNCAGEELIEGLVKYGVKRITVSIDGASQTVYSKYRKYGNYDVVISNIKKLIYYKAKYKSSYPELIWQYILMEHNECEADKAKHLAQELGMKILFKLDWGGRFESKDPERLAEITGLYIFNREDWKKINGKKYTSSMCRQLLTAPQINYDGKLLGCCGVYLNDWAVNVFETGLKKGLNRGDYVHAVIDFLNGNHNPRLDQICQNCSAGLHKQGEKQLLEL